MIGFRGSEIKAPHPLIQAFAMAIIPWFAVEAIGVSQGLGASTIAQTAAQSVGLIIGSGYTTPAKSLEEIQQFMTPGGKQAAALAAKDLPHIQMCKISDGTPSGLPSYWRLVTEKGSELDKLLTQQGKYVYEHDTARVFSLIQMAPNKCRLTKFAYGHHWNVSGWGRVDPVSSLN